MNKEIRCPIHEEVVLLYNSKNKDYYCKECNKYFYARICPICKKEIFQLKSDKDNLIGFCRICRGKHEIPSPWIHNTSFCQIDTTKKYPEEINFLVLKPLDCGCFVEALGQMDALIDEKLFRLFDHWTTYDKVSTLLRRKIFGRTMSEILLGLNVITKEIHNRIIKFKEIRNCLAHERSG